MITSKYYIQNEIGSRKALTIGNRMFLRSVEGLGVGTDFSYADFKNGFSVVSAEEFRQRQIIATLVFVDEAFSEYRSLVDFIMSAEKLFMVYSPDENEYFKEIKVKSLTKANRSSIGIMETDLTLDTLTPWYLPTPSKAVIQVADVDVFRYPFQYGVTRYATSVAGACTANVYGKGHIAGAFTFSYEGTLVNPCLTLTGASGRVYGKCDLQCSLTSTDTLEISTVYANSYVRKISANGTVTDLLEYVDISEEPFPHVPVTEDCTLELTSMAVMSGTAQLTVNYYFTSV